MFRSNSSRAALTTALLLGATSALGFYMYLTDNTALTSYSTILFVAGASFSAVGLIVSPVLYVDDLRQNGVNPNRLFTRPRRQTFNDTYSLVAPAA